MFEATIPQSLVFSFAGQAGQYPQYGMPGISYFKGVISAKVWVNCLLFRDEHGILLGVLNHYPMTSVWEEAGNVNVFIDPAHKRKGIGTALVAECIARWGQINTAQQRFTPEGAAWAERLVLDGQNRADGFGDSLSRPS